MLVILFWSETCSAFRGRSKSKSKGILNRRWFKMVLFWKFSRTKYFSYSTNVGAVKNPV